MQAIRSLTFSMVMYVTVVIFSLIAVLVLPLPFKIRYAVISRWAVMNVSFLELLCGVRFKIEGKENIPDKPAIILSKHQSTWETLAFQKIFPMQVWVLKKELLFLPFFGWGLAALSPIAINRSRRKKAMEQIITQGKQRLDTGRWIVIFPEGTRIMAGKRGKYKLGGARLSESTGYPVLPVAHNAGEFWPKRSFIKNPGTITVRIGKAIYPEGKNAQEINEMVETWIEGQMAEITSKELLPITPV